MIRIVVQRVRVCRYPTAYKTLRNMKRTRLGPDTWVLKASLLRRWSSAHDSVDLDSRPLGKVRVLTYTCVCWCVFSPGPSRSNHSRGDLRTPRDGALPLGGGASSWAENDQRQRYGKDCRVRLLGCACRCWTLMIRPDSCTIVCEGVRGVATQSSRGISSLSAVSDVYCSHSLEHVVPQGFELGSRAPERAAWYQRMGGTSNI